VKISTRVTGSAFERLARFAGSLETDVASAAGSLLGQEIETDRNEFGLAAVLPATRVRVRAAASRAAARTLSRIRKRLK
jgi:hypothetical protein